MRTIVRCLPAVLATGCALSLSACHVVAPPAPLAVHHEGLTGSHVTAVNLLAENGVYLRSSNQLALSQHIPVGTPARITRFTADEVDIEIRHVKYTMTPTHGSFDDTQGGVAQFLEKYFTAADQPVDLDALGPAELATSVQIGRVVKGMTKAQVFVALGPPQWVADPRLSTVRLSKQQILDNDIWTYTEEVLAGLLPKTRTYVFDEGRLRELR